MSGSRPSIFVDNIDLTGFTPKTGSEPGAVPTETSRRIAEEGGFPSRAPVLQPPAAARQPVPKTGRTVLLNARITQRAHDRFHEIVERALQALEREMKGQGT